MISKIRIKNYQSLVDTELQLGRVTVLLGHTDAGKSAVLRAVEQAAHNDPGSDVITVRDGQKAEQASVQFTTETGTVEWIRKDKTTDYWVTTGETTETFRKVQKQTPDAVLQQLAVREVQIDTGSGPTSWSRLQFVGQFDQPFLLVDRGGVAAARILGRLTGVHVFAEASKLARQDGLELQDRLKNLDEQLAALQAEIDQIGDVEGEIDQLIALGEKVEAAKQVEHRARAIDTLYRTIGGIRERRQQVGYDPLVVEQRLAALTPLLQTMWRSIGTADQIDQIARKLYGLRARRTALEAQVVVPPPDTSTIANAVSLLRRVEAVRQDRKAVAGRIQERIVMVEDLQARVADLTATRTRMDAQIPLCPFVEQFDKVAGQSFRCAELLKVVRK